MMQPENYYSGDGEYKLGQILLRMGERAQDEAFIQLRHIEFPDDGFKDHPYRVHLRHMHDVRIHTRMPQQAYDLARAALTNLDKTQLELLKDMMLAAINLPGMPISDDTTIPHSRRTDISTLEEMINDFFDDLFATGRSTNHIANAADRAPQNALKHVMTIASVLMNRTDIHWQDGTEYNTRIFDPNDIDCLVRQLVPDYPDQVPKQANEYFTALLAADTILRTSPVGKIAKKLNQIFDSPEMRSEVVPALVRVLEQPVSGTSTHPHVAKTSSTHYDIEDVLRLSAILEETYRDHRAYRIPRLISSTIEGHPDTPDTFHSKLPYIEHNLYDERFHVPLMAASVLLAHCPIEDIQQGMIDEVNEHHEGHPPHGKIEHIQEQFSELIEARDKEPPSANFVGM